MALASSESSIEQACRRLAHSHGCTLLKVQGTKGWPDRILLSPRGKVMFLEFKRPGEKPDPFQAYILEQLRSQHFKAEYVTCQMDFLEYMSKLLQQDSKPNTGFHMPINIGG